MKNNIRSKKTVPEYDINAKSVLDINKIYEILPHRYPFALVDKVLKIEKENILTLKNVTINEPFFVGHFPNFPVMPGVLQVEALAQTGAIMLVKTVEDPQDYWTFFLGIENCKFRQTVVPGDTIIMECILDTPIKRNIVTIYGRSFVKDKLACEAKISAMIVKKDKN